MMDASKRKLQHVRMVTLLLLLVFMLADIKVPVYKNLAYLSLSKALVPDHIRATDRQARLEDFVTYLQLVENREFSLPPIDNLSEITMLRAIFIGQCYLSRGNLDKAASWYLQAVQSDPFPIQQNSLLHSWQGNLSADGNVLIDDFSDTEDWMPDAHNNVPDVIFESIDGIGFISYQNHPNQRDWLAYSLFPNPSSLLLSYHTVLSVRIKLDTGTYLTLATKIDDVRERHLNYYQGARDWETLRFPLTGDVLKEIKFSFSEPTGEPEMVRVYKVWIDWIKLEVVD